MPVTLAQIAANTASVTFAVGNETVTIVYYPGRVTEKTIAQTEAMKTMTGETMEARYSAFNTALAGLIQSWDVMEDDGVTMWPLEPGRLAELPVGFRMQVIGAILGDLRPETAAPQMNGAH